MTHLSTHIIIVFVFSELDFNLAWSLLVILSSVCGQSQYTWIVHALVCTLVLTGYRQLNPNAHVCTKDFSHNPFTMQTYWMYMFVHVVQLNTFSITLTFIYPDDTFFIIHICKYPETISRNIQKCITVTVSITCTVLIPVHIRQNFIKMLLQLSLLQNKLLVFGCIYTLVW